MNNQAPSLPTGDIDRLIDPWWNRWIGMHWGFRRNAVAFWCASGSVQCHKLRGILDIDSSTALDVVIFYRELVCTLTPEYQLAHLLVDLTPRAERKQIKRFFAGNLVFSQPEGNTRTIAQLIETVTRPAGLPRLWPTDDSDAGRIASSRTVFDGLRRTTTLRAPQIEDELPEENSKTPLLFISEACPKLIRTIPRLQADEKEKEDVRKVGNQQDDIWEACKNAFREYPQILASEPLDVRRWREINRTSDPLQQRLNMIEFDHKNKQKSRMPRRFR